MATQISQSLREFLQQRLASIEQIEVVLLLRRHRARSWSAPEVAAELGTAPEPAAMRLFLLASAGLIVFEAAGLPRYRYEAADAAVEMLLGELAELYEHDPTSLPAFIGMPVADPIRSFADAFKFKR